MITQRLNPHRSVLEIMYRTKNSLLRSKQTNKQTTIFNTFLFRNVEESTTHESQQQQTYKQTVTHKHKQTENRQRKNEDISKQKFVNTKHDKKPQQTKQQQHPLQNLQTAPQKSGMFCLFTIVVVVVYLFVRSKYFYSRNRGI